MALTLPAFGLTPPPGGWKGHDPGHLLLAPRGVRRAADPVTSGTAGPPPGTGRAYWLARPKRDRVDLLRRVEQGELSPLAAAVEAGWTSPLTWVRCTPESFATRAVKHLTGRGVVALIAYLQAPATIPTRSPAGPAPGARWPPMPPENTPENNGGTARTRPGGVTGRGFLPGQSGNPGGRPQGRAALVREQTGDGAELVVFVLQVLRNPRRPVPLRTQAATWLSDRGVGKPVQQLDATMALDVDASLSGCSVCASQERAREAIRAHLTEGDVDRTARALLGPD